MKFVAVGSEGLVVSRIGLGCMGMSHAYRGADPAESEAVIRAAVGAGITLFDTADVYGPYTNERLVGRVLAPYRDRAVICTKFGNVTLPDGSRRLDGRPEYVREACDASLQRLGTEVIDVYLQHRVDPSVPIEETVGAMGELVLAGKVRFLGLSEASAATIRRAHAVFPLSVVQSEYSLWTRDVESTVMPTLRTLGIGLMAYSPLGRGFLAGAIRDRSALDDRDVRRDWPRFSDSNLRRNLALLAALEQVAACMGASPSQVALAWVLHQGSDVVPIFGTSKRSHLEENLDAYTMSLSKADLVELASLVDKHGVEGDRYPPEFMGRLEG